MTFPLFPFPPPYRSLLRTEERSERALSKAEEAERRLEEVELLESQVERLTIFSRALWEIAKEKLGCTDAEILARMQAIDARADAGTASSAAARTCAACERTVSSRHGQCLYCGAPMPAPSPTLP